MNSQRLVVVPGEEIGTINPFLHGHFSEHLGECVYPGIFVSPAGAIANTNGLRNDVVAALKPLEVPVLRWPGGCFADDYHWRDGIGPVDQRPRRLNRHWGWTPETSEFGTHEFIDFCRAIGTEPYFAANVGSGTPQEMSDWIEYCNFDGDSNLAKERQKNGAEKPFGIKYWGIGNENWGCGGDMTPEEYGGHFNRFRGYAGDLSGTTIEAIACGQNNNDWAWTRRFLEHMRHNYQNRLRRVGGLAAHYYVYNVGGEGGTATQYSDEQWTEMLARAFAVEGIVTGVRGIMDEYDPERRIKMILDEWGAWHPVEEGRSMGGLYQQNTVRDACVAALSLDVFHNHADKIYMANIAQLINVLQAVLLVEEDKCIKTPTYHVFDLYRAHKGAQAVRCESLADTISDGGSAARRCQSLYLNATRFGLRAVHGSASLKDGQLCVTAVNTHPTEAVELEVQLHGATWGEVEVVQLEADGIRAYNTFAEPNNVKLSAPRSMEAREGMARLQVAPGGVVRLRGAAG